MTIDPQVSTKNQVGGRFDFCESLVAICQEHNRKHEADGWCEVASWAFGCLNQTFRIRSRIFFQATFEIPARLPELEGTPYSRRRVRCFPRGRS